MKRMDVLKVVMFVFILQEIVFSKESIILKRNIFTAPPPKIETKNILKPPPLPSLDSIIEILGIVYFPNDNSFVIIRDKRKNTEEIYKVGDNIGQAKIVKIEVDRVFFEYDNKTICLNFENKVEEGPFVSILKKEPEESSQKNPHIKLQTDLSQRVVVVDFNKTIASLENDRNLIEKVNILPNVNNGKIEGFRVFNLPENSIPYQYGLRNGDIIVRVNGVLIDSIATGFNVYNQIKNSDTDTVTVDIIRGGQPMSFTYKLNRDR